MAIRRRKNSNFEKCGFFVITIWESDYNKKDWQTSLKQILEVYEKENINAL